MAHNDIRGSSEEGSQNSPMVEKGFEKESGSFEVRLGEAYVKLSQFFFETSHDTGFKPILEGAASLLSGVIREGSIEEAIHDLAQAFGGVKQLWASDRFEGLENDFQNVRKYGSVRFTDGMKDALLELQELIREYFSAQLESDRLNPLLVLIMSELEILRVRCETVMEFSKLEANAVNDVLETLEMINLAMYRIFSRRELKAGRPKRQGQGLGFMPDED